MKKLLLMLLMSISFCTFAQVNDSVQANTPKFENTDKALAKAIEKAIVVAEKTGNFVVDQAPDLVKEFYSWRMYSNIFWIVISIISILLARYIPYMFLTKTESRYYGESFFGRYGNDTFWWWATFVMMLLLGGLTILVCTYDLIFLISSPKLYLIEYFMKLSI